MLSATASLGLVLLWDVDSGLSEIDKYLYSTDEAVKVNIDIKNQVDSLIVSKAGALLACGIVNCGVKNECDPALAILSEYVTHKDMLLRIGAIMGSEIEKSLGKLTNFDVDLAWLTLDLHVMILSSCFCLF